MELDTPKSFFDLAGMSVVLERIVKSLRDVDQSTENI